MFGEKIFINYKYFIRLCTNSKGELVYVLNDNVISGDLDMLIERIKLNK